MSSPSPPFTLPHWTRYTTRGKEWGRRRWDLRTRSASTCYALPRKRASLDRIPVESQPKFNSRSQPILTVAGQPPASDPHRQGELTPTNSLVQISVSGTYIGLFSLVTSWPSGLFFAPLPSHHQNAIPSSVSACATVLGHQYHFPHLVLALR